MKLLPITPCHSYSFILFIELLITVEPPNSGQNGNGTFVHCREAVPYRKQLLLGQFSLLFYDCVGSHAVSILFRIIISCEITNIVTSLSGHVK